MTTQSLSEPTLRDLFRALRRHGLLLVAAMTIAVASSIAYSLTRTPTYTAEASIAFRDQTRDMALAGVPIPTTQQAQTPQQLATANVRTVTDSEVASLVKERMRSSRSIEDLSDMVTAVVQPNAGVIEIEASASTPKRAQALANAFADATVAIDAVAFAAG